MFWDFFGRVLGSANGYRIPVLSLCFYMVYNLPHPMVPHPVPQVQRVRRFRRSEAVHGSPETHFESSRFSFSSLPLTCRTQVGSNQTASMWRFHSRNRSDRIHGIMLRQIPEHVHPQFSEDT
jgi:hypothetical protein